MTRQNSVRETGFAPARKQRQQIDAFELRVGGHRRARGREDRRRQVHRDADLLR